MSSAGNDLEVGDAVTVPGDMYGIVRFVGSVKGKAGKFVGVELDREFAARGKNDGDVEGIFYFRTQIPGAGIFLPIHRAEKRSSPRISVEGDDIDGPLTPNTPTSIASGGGGGGYGGGYGGGPASNFHTKFSQTIGHGAQRPSSPHFKPKRPSLPRPESPLRRPPPLTATPGGNSSRQLSASVRGGSRPAMPTTTPSKNAVNMRASTAGSRPSTGQGHTPRPYSRTGSRMGNREEVGTAKTTSSRNQSNGSVKSFSQPLRSQSRLGSAGGQDDEIQRLKLELAERDKRLAEQAANLADMDASVKELSGLLPPDGMPQDGRRPSYGGDDGADANTAQLRQMLREKNEKITILTSEFDAHRADFRSTLDSLEMASTETERVYEEQKRDLLAQIQAMEEQAREYEDMNGSRKEFEDVANQLKGLEEFVQELEEGLEDARRGEAEARGEVEFLRGEVERGRSELKREREKAAASAHGGGGGAGGKDMEKLEDEIRGLKAIIHSFSTTSPPTTPMIGGGDRLSKQLEESEKARMKLEGEMEQLRRDLAATTPAPANGSHSRNESEMTTVAARPRADTVKKAAAPPMPAPTTTSKFCDMCESSEHDTLDCNTFQEAEESLTDGGDEHNTTNPDGKGIAGLETSFPGDRPAPLSLSPVKSRQGSVGDGANKENAGEAKKEGKKDLGDPWCALCEKEGHFAMDCPDEQY